MALVATLTQSQAALPGRPTNFVLAVLNTSTAVNITGLQAFVTNTSGTLGFPCNIGPFIAPIGTSIASTSGVGFNIQVGSSSTVYFPFTIQFFAQAILGSRTEPNNQYQVNVNGIASDGTVFAPPGLNGVVNVASLGVQAAFLTGQLNFSFAANSGLIL